MVQLQSNCQYKNKGGALERRRKAEWTRGGGDVGLKLKEEVENLGVAVLAGPPLTNGTSSYANLYRV